MSRAIRIHETGGPEVMRWEEVDVGAPGPGEARVRHTAIGLNFIDIYDRTGLYVQPLPTGLGREAAGVVEAVGKKVRGLKVGDRIAYTFPAPGAYSERRLVPAERLVRLPHRPPFLFYAKAARCLTRCWPTFVKCPAYKS